MAWKKNKWKFAILVYLVFLNVFTKSLPIVDKTRSFPTIASKDLVVVQDNAYLQIDELATENVLEQTMFIKDLGTTEAAEDITMKIDTVDLQENDTTLLRNDPIRPGQIVTLYSIEITPNGLWQTFSGRAIIRVELQAATREDPIIFHAEGLNIQSVQFGLLSLGNPLPADFFVDEDLLWIEPPAFSSTYIFLIHYTGPLRNDGSGLYQGSYGDTSYIAMNLHPTNARRVFPSMDEPSQESTISFTIVNMEHNFISGNSIIESTDNNQIEFTALQGPPHRWGFVAHNFVNIGIYPLINARLYVRAGIQSQDQVTSTIINAIFPRFEEWTNREYSEIHQGQNEILDIFAMPDIVKEWHALSTICIWEPYILMSIQHGVTHRKTAIIEISKAISNQWFGYVIYPENWRYQWINTGLATHSAFEMAKAFQGDAFEGDNTVIDINTVFVSEIIQESMFRDGYSNSRPLEPSDDLFDQEPIRDHVNGIIKYKAPAIMHMLKQTLGQTVADPNVDYVQAAARALLNVRSLQTFNSLNFYDAVNSEWIGAFNPFIEDLPLFMEPWVESANYPVVNVQTRINSIGLTQETFSYTNVAHVTFDIPITYTSRVNPDFNDLTPRSILGASDSIPITLGEDDWFLLNIQGQGYYRVNYDEVMWERIILALEDKDQRAEIHPLNRATLVDDALNLARAGRLDYDIAFRVVLTMLHELEYPVWKAYVRNMDWIRKRLVAMVDDEEAELDRDIYLRMVRRTIDSVEDEIGFYPDPLIIEDAMTSMTRGLVMEHACKANYAPCIAAAVDWFYDPDSNEPVVNQDIPHDIRPAVFCTMMREGDVTARDALWERFDEETSHYERLVIVKAMACSSDQNYLTSFLNEAISGGGRLGVEERFQFFIAMIESSVANADLALRYIRINTRGIRNMFGGSDKLEEIITTLAENVVDEFMTENLDIWINSMNSDIDDSLEVALRNAAIAAENMIWNRVHMEFVYDWIDENDAHTVAISFALMVVCCILNVFNQ